MKGEADVRREGGSWTPWTGPPAAGVDDQRARAGRTRLQAFRVLLTLGTVALLFIVIRAAVVQGEATWADVANAAFFALLLGLSFARPGWLNALTWLGLASLFLNAVDGLDFHAEQVLAPVHLLLPLFILYAALLGDLYMSAVAMVGVLGIYAATWLVHGDLDLRETLALSNLIILTVVSGAAALGVWLRHLRLERQLELQARALRTELETRLRIQAMVTHDIRTPLTVLLNATELNDKQSVEQMAGRISDIVEAAQGLGRGSGMSLSVVTIGQIWEYTRESLGAKLSAKEQTLQLAGTADLKVEVDLPVLCNSVLGNFLSNAIKFSPRGATIRMQAELVDGSVRIAVFDDGPGLPAEVVLKGPEELNRQSGRGTEGETGSGYGLQIAALCAARMKGRIEFQEAVSGGAVSVVLPLVNQ